MEYKIYKETDFITSKWTGGTTRQLAIFPQESKYLERNFVWRLSSATCDLEETTFSKLPDYDRVLMVLSGDVVLAHQILGKDLAALQNGSGLVGAETGDALPFQQVHTP